MAGFLFALEFDEVDKISALSERQIDAETEVLPGLPRPRITPRPALSELFSKLKH